MRGINKHRAYPTQPAGLLSFRVPARTDQKEWLDLGYGSLQDTYENLHEMDALNTLSRGTGALLKHLGPRLLQIDGPARLVDLGTGSGSLPLYLAKWSQKRSLDIHFYGVDWSRRNLACAKQALRERPGVELLCADACQLPFRALSIQYAVSSLFIHHFSPDELVPLLRAAFQVVTHGLVMTDLVRGWLPLFAFRLIQPFFARNHLTRHDGALSIRRAYRPQELLAIARKAGLANARVYSHFPWRMTLVVDK